MDWAVGSASEPYLTTKFSEDGKDGKFDTILVYKLDRLSRSANAAIRLLLDLDDAGIG